MKGMWVRLLLMSLWSSLPTAAASDPAPPWIESYVEPVNPYLQQQVVYTLRLYRHSHLQRGSFLKPTIQGAILKRLDELGPEPVVHDGTEYELIEQRYLLFPQESGTLHLPAPVFSSRDLFVEGKPLTLEVKPGRPAPGIDHWLISPEVWLDEIWSSSEAGWLPGDHLQRSVTIRAVGVTGAQLPQPSLGGRLPGMEIQQFRNSVSESIEAGQLIGKRTIDVLYIPYRSGRFPIEPISIGWWNSVDNGPSASTLPGRVLEIKPAVQPVSGRPAADTLENNPTPGVNPSHAPLTWFAGIAPWVLLLMLLPVLILWPLRGRLTRLLRLLPSSYRMWKACLGNAPGEARDILISQAGRAFAPGRPINLHVLAAGYDRASAKKALLDLDRALYSGEGRPWQGRNALAEMLLLLITDGEASHTQTRGALPPLWIEPRKKLR